MRKYTLAILLFSMVYNAQASGDGGLWAGLVAFVCLEQDISNQQTPMGKPLVSKCNGARLD